MAERLLQDQIAVVTGAGRGIGRAVAKALAMQGASLVLAARTTEQLESVSSQCQALGASAVAVVQTDLADPKQVDALADAVHSQFGGADVLVNNAGIFADGKAQSGDPDEWDQMLAVNLSAPMRLTRRFTEKMIERERGLIVNIGSVAAVEPMTSSGAYAATKFGLRGWSLSCYEALRLHGIKVMLVNPAFVNTDLVSGVPGVLSERMLTPDDVAEAVLLGVRSSPMCCPQEITLRLTKSAFPDT